MKFKDLNREDRQVVKDFIFDKNMDIACLALLGFNTKKLAPSKKNLQKFQEQFSGHPMCGCYSCMELAKTFVSSTPDMKEDVVSAAMMELEVVDITVK